MLEVSDLRVSYGAVRALEGVSLTVESGVTTAVLGANGAGKTSLLRAMTGLVKAKEGRVSWKGTELTRLPSEEIVRLGVSHVPEGRGVIQDLTVEDNLRLGGLWRSDREDRRRALEEMYEFFPPLRERRRRHAFTLSGGERQMLAVGRALMARPELLLLDEPSLGLAPMIVAQIMELVARQAAETGLTVLLVEQNARAALSISQRAVVLSLGKVVVEGPAAEIAADEDLRHHYLGF
jgi:branched-chain amino acid transport system ATP-binding protein